MQKSTENSSSRRNIVPYKELGIRESNAYVRMLTEVHR